MFVNGIKQRNGTLLHINASDLSDGSAVTLDTLSSISTGTLLNAITTTSDGHVDGAIRLIANEMKSGTGMKINSNGLTNGTALHVTSNGDSKVSCCLIEGGLQSQVNLAEISVSNLMLGTALKMVSGDVLTAGRVVHILSNSSFTGSISSPSILDIDGTLVSKGRVVRLSVLKYDMERPLKL